MERVNCAHPGATTRMNCFCPTCGNLLLGASLQVRLQLGEGLAGQSVHEMIQMLWRNERTVCAARSLPGASQLPSRFLGSRSPSNGHDGCKSSHTAPEQLPLVLRLHLAVPMRQRCCRNWLLCRRRLWLRLRCLWLCLASFFCSIECYQWFVGPTFTRAGPPHQPFTRSLATPASVENANGDNLYACSTCPYVYYIDRKARHESTGDTPSGTPPGSEGGRPATWVLAIAASPLEGWHSCPAPGKARAGSVADRCLARSCCRSPRASP